MGFLVHLKVLLWKNARLKLRHPIATCVEILVPLTLFVLLAWVRTRVPVVENDPVRPFPLGQTSSGPVGVLQGYLCGGQDFDSNKTRNSALQQAMNVFIRRNISWEDVQPIVQDLSTDTQTLASTLTSMHQDYVSMLGQRTSMWDLGVISKTTYDALQAAYSANLTLPRDLAAMKPVRRSSAQPLVSLPADSGDVTPLPSELYTNPLLPNYYSSFVTKAEEDPWFEVDLQGEYQISHVDVVLASPLLPPLQGEAQDPRCVHWLPDAQQLTSSFALFNSTLTLSKISLDDQKTRGGQTSPSDIRVPLSGVKRLPDAGIPSGALLLAPVNGTFLPSPGAVADFWDYSEPGNQAAVTFLSSSPKDSSPDRTSTLDRMEIFSSDKSSYNFAVRMRSVFQAPMDGSYSFLMVSDFRSALWVGRLENTSVPQSMVRILDLRYGGPFHDYRPSDQVAQPIYLAKGDRLFLEARAVQQSICGHLSVAVILPNGVTLDPIPASVDASSPDSSPSRLATYRVNIPPEVQSGPATRFARIELNGFGSLNIKALRVFSNTQSSMSADSVVARQVFLRDSLVRACSALRTGSALRVIEDSVPHASECLTSEDIKIDPTPILLGSGVDITDDVLAQILRSCRFRVTALGRILDGTQFKSFGISAPNLQTILNNVLLNLTRDTAPSASSSKFLSDLRAGYAAVLNNTAASEEVTKALDMLTGLQNDDAVDLNLCNNSTQAMDDSYLVLRTQACLEKIQREAKGMSNVLGAIQELSGIPAVARMIAGGYDLSSPYVAAQLVCPSRAPDARRRRDDTFPDNNNADDGGDPSDSGGGGLPDFRYSRGLQRILMYTMNPDTHIHYSPNTPAVTNLMRLAIQPFYQAATVMAVLGCISGGNPNPRRRVPLSSNWVESLLIGFPDENSMIAASMGEDKRFSVLAAVAFHNITSDVNLPKKLSYSIRMEENHIPDPRFLKPRSPIETRWGRKTWYRYYYSGFLLVQDAIDRAFLDIQAGKRVAAPMTYTNEMTIPAYISDPFTNSIAATLPLFMVLAWIYSVSMLVKSVVYEKEHRLREAMKMMGLGSVVHFLGWLITSLILLTLSVTMMTMLLCLGGVLPQSDPFLVWCFLELFALSSIALSFLISCFFDRAKLASACAGIIYFIMYLPYIFLSLNENGVSYSSRLWASLSSTTAFGLGCEYLAKFERLGSGANFHNLYQGMDDCDEFTLGTAMGMMLIDILLYSTLTWYLTEAWPGEYGVPRPWYFPFTREYWLGSRPVSDSSSRNALSGFLPAAESPCRVYEPARQSTSPGVQIRNLVKTYSTGSCSKKDQVRAVRGVSMDIYEAQITALLGHNGAGKTTLMSILTGLFPPSSGTVLVNGRNVATELTEIRKSLGVCPQYNVLFDDLSALEHLLFCARLKGLSWKEANDQATSFLSDLGLLKDKHTLSKNLSGGMKRKLSVCMAFIGGSKLVILDEPSAGMDPHARRSCWDLLLKYRKERTVIISTHHLDEADLLGDRIAIMSSGKLRCMGSSLFLKRHYGAGYHVTISTVSGADIGKLKNFFASEAVGAVFLESKGTDTTFWLPGDKAEMFADLFQRLESRKAELELTTYGVTATTLEEVFLKVTKEADEEDAQESPDDALLHGAFSLRSKGSRPARAAGVHDEEDEGGEEGLDDDKNALLDFGADDEPGDRVPLVPTGSSKVSKDRLRTTSLSVPSPVSSAHVSSGRDAYEVAGEDDFAERIQLGQYSGPTIQGWRLNLRIFWALFLKRLQNAKRDRKAIFSQILLPAVFVTIAMAVATAFPPQDELPPRELTVRMFSDSCEASHEANFVPFVFEARSHFGQSIADQIPVLAQGLNLSNEERYLHPSGSCGLNCSYPHNFSSYTLDTFTDLGADRKGAITLQDIRDPSVGYFAGEADPERSRLVMRAWFDSRWTHGMPAFLNLANNALLRAVLGSDDVSITTFSHPINRTLSQRTAQYLKSGTDLTVAINIIIAMSFVPASFVLFLVWERANKSKHLQFVSGVTGSVYWLSNYTWDIVNYLVPCVISMIIFYAFGLPAYTGRNFSGVCLLLLLYGWSVTPLMYPASWLFSVPSTAYVTLICINLFTGLTCTLATFMLELFSSDPYLVHLNKILRWVFLLFPNYALGRGLMDMARNEYNAQYYLIVNGDGSRYQDPLQWNIIGKNLVFMLVEGFAYFLLTILIEKWRTLQFKKLQWSSSRAPPSVSDVDVNEERRTVKQQSTPEDEVLFVNGLTRVYRSRGKTKTAVNDLCFRVPRGECFGLLGVNGAGKTSTFKMITGDIAVTRGDAWVAGHSILTAMSHVRQTLGYTPQFDALSPLLTGRETLQMYARVRGVPESAIPDLVSHAIANLNLTKWADRVSQTYSGGNKRKLSVAVALLGQPELLLLDEPTAGVDAQSRRFLWQVILAVVRSGRSVLLTSHAMDECQALCGRIAIMVNGEFQCLGSTQHLKDKYGEGYTIILKVRPPEAVQAGQNADCLWADAGPIKLFFDEHFPGAILDEEHNGYLQYTIPRKNMPALSDVFRTMEQCRRENNLEDYSVSQTSLDSVFCKFADLQDSERADEQNDVHMEPLNEVLVGDEDENLKDDTVESFPLIPQSSSS